MFNADFKQERCGDYETCVTEEFWRAFAVNGGITLHINVLYGSNAHHEIEAIFKAVAHAMKIAVSKMLTVLFCQQKEYFNDYFPAIDIIDSKPVRLFKGDFATAEQVADDVLETANGFVQAGAEWVHMVDLDGSLKKSESTLKPLLMLPLKLRSR